MTAVFEGGQRVFKASKVNRGVGLGVGTIRRCGKHDDVCLRKPA
jgi:hypothetical protein